MNIYLGVLKLSWIRKMLFRILWLDVFILSFDDKRKVSHTLVEQMRS